jgi:hypothetical protein
MLGLRPPERVIPDYPAALCVPAAEKQTVHGLLAANGEPGYTKTWTWHNTRSVSSQSTFLSGPQMPSQSQFMPSSKIAGPMLRARRPVQMSTYIERPNRRYLYFGEGGMKEEECKMT